MHKDEFTTDFLRRTWPHLIIEHSLSFLYKVWLFIVKLHAASKTLLRDPWHSHKSFIFGCSPRKPFSLLYFLLFRNEIPTALSNRALLVRVVCSQNNCFLWTKNSKTVHDNILQQMLHNCACLNGKCFFVKFFSNNNIKNFLSPFSWVFQQRHCSGSQQAFEAGCIRK